MRRPANSQIFLWALLALPAGALLLLWASGVWSYGQAVSQSGEWAAQLLIVTLAATPLRRVMGVNMVTRFLMRRRRDLGVAVFCYAGLHTIIYVMRKADVARIWAESQDLWLLAGWIALVIFLALTITSNNWATKALRKNWQRLHRLVYAGAILMLVHWVLSAFDPTKAYIYMALLIGIEALRFWPRRHPG